MGKTRFACWAMALLLLLGTFSSAVMARAGSPASFSFSVMLLDAYVGQEIDLRTQLTGNVDAQDITFTSSDSSVVRIGEGSLAVIAGEGSSLITAVAGDGQSAQMHIHATNATPARRALLLTERMYDDGRVRTGAVNAVQGISDMLSSLRYRTGTSFAVTVRVDNTEQSIRRAIHNTFGESQDGDIGLFYISGHGEIVNDEPCLLLHDGTTISVRLLEELLRPVRGRMIVLLDFCQSGSFIGSTASQLLVDSATNCFTNSALLNGKYLVMTSCGSDEDSYRLSDTGETNESAMSTVFARALCEGLGWDLDNDRSVSLRADTDRNGVVTFTELWLYTRRRVYYHLAGTGVIQTVMAWPEVNEADLFARQFVPGA